MNEITLKKNLRINTPIKNPNMNTFIISTPNELKNEIKNCSLRKISKNVKMYYTPELAKLLLSEYKFYLQRQISVINLKDIHTRITSGTFDFRLDDLQLGILPTGDAFLLNGNHRTNVISGAYEDKIGKLDIETPVIEVKILYHDTIEQIQETYTKIDSHKARSNKDQLRALGTSQNIGINEQDCSSMSIAVQKIVCGYSSEKKSTEFLNNIMLDDKISNAILILFDIINNNDTHIGIRQVIKSSEFLAWALVIIIEQESKARQFLTEMLRPECLYSKEHPIYKIRNILIEYKGGKNPTRNQKTVLYNKLCYSWEKFYQNKKFSHWRGCEITNVDKSIVRNNIPYTSYKSVPSFSENGRKIFNIGKKLEKKRNSIF